MRTPTCTSLPTSGKSSRHLLGGIITEAIVINIARARKYQGTGEPARCHQALRRAEQLPTLSVYCVLSSHDISGRHYFGLLQDRNLTPSSQSRVHHYRRGSHTRRRRSCSSSQQRALQRAISRCPLLLLQCGRHRYSGSFVVSSSRTGQQERRSSSLST